MANRNLDFGEVYDFAVIGGQPTVIDSTDNVQGVKRLRKGLQVTGSISASGDIFGVTGSFHYITASIVDVNADTVRIGGEKMNRTLLQNLKDGFDSDTRATQPGANFKAGIRTAGSITASSNISSSGNIIGDKFIGTLDGGSF